MPNIKKYKVGMRTIKTGLSVWVSLSLAQLFKLKSPSFVGIAAIVSMQSTVSESFVIGKNRMMGTFIGAFIGLMFSYLLPHNYFVLGIGIIVVIHIHNLFKWKQSLSLSAIVFLAVFLNQENARLSYAIHRLYDTFIGITVSMFINYFIAFPDNKKSFLYIDKHIYKVLKDLTYDIITKLNEFDENVINQRLDAYNNSFDALKNEMYMNSSKNDSSKLALDMVRILDNVEKGLLTILELDINPILNEENQILFSNLYSQEYQDVNRENNDTDIIYNYHLNKILNKLLNVEELL